MAPLTHTAEEQAVYETAADQVDKAIAAIRGVRSHAETEEEPSFDIGRHENDTDQRRFRRSNAGRNGYRTIVQKELAPVRIKEGVDLLNDTINAYEAKVAAKEPVSKYEKEQYDLALAGLTDTADILNTATPSGAVPATTLAHPGINALNEARAAGANNARAAAAAATLARPESVGGLDPVTDAGERAIQIRNALQCWLLYNMEVLAEYNEKNVSIDGSNSIDEPGFQSTHLQPSSHNQRIILTSKQSSGFALTGKLQARKGTESFKTIQTHEYAQLMPSLRIFKVHNDFVTGKKKTIEMEFNNHTSLDGIARELTTHRPDGAKYKIFNKGSEVGVKSFEWTFLGTDSFTATRDIAATLKLSAQSFGPFVQIRKSIPNSEDVDSDTEPEPYRYVDLLVQPDCETEWAPECYEVRIDVGYAPIGDTGTAAVRKGIKDSVQCQKDMLYLVLTDHAFSINEDGSIDLTINFRGRLETLMKSRKMNVLFPYGGALQDKISLNVKDIGWRRAADAEKELAALMKKPKKTSTDETNIKSYEQALKDLNVQYKQIIHSHIIDMLFESGKIKQYSIPELEFILFKNYQAKLSQNQGLPPTVNLTDLENKTTGIKTPKEVRDGDLPAAATSQEALEEGIETTNSQITQLNETAQRKVRFFFLGDLLAVVLQSITGDNTVMGSINDNGWFASLWGPSATIDTTVQSPHRAGAALVQKLFERFRIILGNIDLDYARTSNYGAAKKINLAHIPISLDAYTAFFANNVLAKETTNYPFFSFIDDVLNDLVMDPLSSQCFDGLFNIKFRPRVQSLVVPSVIDNKWYLEEATAIPAGGPAPPGTIFARYKTLNLNEVPVEEPLFDYCAFSENVENLFEYLVISSEVTDLSVLQGVEEEDRKMGILHLDFGNAFSMMKKINFQKTDMEYLPEVRYATEGNFLFNQLANVYDVNIEMIGNNLFKPGQYVYIDAAAIGAGAPWDRSPNGTNRSWANLMGLGGYHLITEVAHSISVDGFNTNLKARWVSSGLREGIPEVPANGPNQTP